MADRTSGGSLLGQAISDLFAGHPAAVLGLATGSSPEPVYDDLLTR